MRAMLLTSIEVVLAVVWLFVLVASGFNTGEAGAGFLAVLVMNNAPWRRV